MPLPESEADAMHSYGTRIYYAPWVSTGLANATLISDTGLKSVSLNGRSLSDVKVTHMLSPGFAHEYIPGFYEGGTVDLAFHYSVDLLEALESYVAEPDRAAPEHGRFILFIVDPQDSYIRAVVYQHPPDVQFEEDQPISIGVKLKVAKGRPTFTVAP